MANTILRNSTGLSILRMVVVKLADGSPDSKAGNANLKIKGRERRIEVGAKLEMWQRNSKIQGGQVPEGESVN